MGLAGLLGFVGYNSWKKQSAGAAGTSTLGTASTGQVNDTQTKVVFSYHSNEGNRRHYVYDIPTNATKQFNIPNGTGYSSVVSVSPNGATALFPSPTDSKFVSMSLADGALHSYELETYITKCGVGGDTYRVNARLINDGSIYFVKPKYDCSGSTPKLIGGTVAKIDRQNSVTDVYSSAVDVDKLLAVDALGMSYQSTDGTYVNADINGVTKSRLTTTWGTSEIYRSPNGTKLAYKALSSDGTRYQIYTGGANDATHTAVISPSDTSSVYLHDVSNDGSILYSVPNTTSPGSRTLLVRTADLRKASVGDMGNTSTSTGQSAITGAQFADNTIVYTYTIAKPKTSSRTMKIVPYMNGRVDSANVKTIQTTDLVSSLIVDLYPGSNQNWAY